MEREEVIQRIMAAWMCEPHLRLGQFIWNAVETALHSGQFMSDLFYITDEKLVEICESYVRSYNDIHDDQSGGHPET